MVLDAVFSDSRIISESVLYANGTRSPEEIALEEAGDAARGSVVYMNLEPGLCHGDNSSVRALIASGVKRAVIGIRNPLEFASGVAIRDLRNAGIEVSHKRVYVAFAHLWRNNITACSCLNRSMCWGTRA